MRWQEWLVLGLSLMVVAAMYLGMQHAQPQASELQKQRSLVQQTLDDVSAPHHSMSAASPDPRTALWSCEHQTVLPEINGPLNRTFFGPDGAGYRNIVRTAWGLDGYTQAATRESAGVVYLGCGRCYKDESGSCPPD